MGQCLVLFYSSTNDQQEFQRGCYKCLQCKKTVNGVKENTTWLHLFSNFDLLNEIAIGYMLRFGLGA